MTKPLAPLAHAQIPVAVREVVTQLQAQGHQAYLVGGCVRDLLRGQTPGDFDVATSALPQQVQNTFKKVIPTGIEHGTVTVLSKGMPIEVTTFRSESDYVDGRRPGKVKFENDIKADLSRRDFTINAMAYEPVSQELVDVFGGQEDLARAVIRCVGVPSERFSEDGLRTLRAIRFAAVLDFEIDKDTFQAIAQYLDVFRKVAIERIQVEFVKILQSEHPLKGMQLLSQSQLLDQFLPELKGAESNWAIVQQMMPPSLAQRLTILFYSHSASAARQALMRLKFPNPVINDVEHWLKHQQLPLPTATDAQIRKYLSVVSPEHALVICQLAAHIGNTQALEMKKRMEALLQNKPPLKISDLAVDGKYLMNQFSVAAGPHIGEALRRLLDKVIENPELNTVEKLEVELINSNFQQFSTK